MIVTCYVTWLILSGLGLIASTKFGVAEKESPQKRASEVSDNSAVVARVLGPPYEACLPFEAR